MQFDLNVAVKKLHFFKNKNQSEVFELVSAANKLLSRVNIRHFEIVSIDRLNKLTERKK